LRKLPIDTGNSALHRRRNIDMKEWPILPMHSCNLHALIPINSADLILCFRVMQLRSHSIVEGCIAVHWVPVLARGKALTINVSEARGCQGSLGPAAVDGSEMPFYRLGCGVAVELCAYVDESLDRCYIDVVDCAEIEDNGSENGSVVVEVDLLSATRALGVRSVNWVSVHHAELTYQDHSMADHQSLYSDRVLWDGKWSARGAQARPYNPAG
jgi:hypothetical protein